MSPQLQEDAREAPRALGIAQQDNSDLRALEVRVSELATDFRGLTRSLARERQRTAALRIEQEARESWGNRIPSISAFPSASSRPPSPWQQNTSPQAAGLSDGVPPPPAPMPSVYSSYVPSGATQSSINPPPAPPAPTHSAQYKALLAKYQQLENEKLGLTQGSKYWNIKHAAPAPPPPPGLCYCCCYCACVCLDACRCWPPPPPPPPTRGARCGERVWGGV